MQTRVIRKLPTVTASAPLDTWNHHRLDSANLARHFARRGRTSEALNALGDPTALEWSQGKRTGVGMRALIENLGVALVQVSAPVRLFTLWDWRIALRFAAYCLSDTVKDVLEHGTVDIDWPGFQIARGVCASALAATQGGAPLSKLESWMPAIVDVRRFGGVELMMVSAMRELSKAAHDPMMPAEVARYCRIARGAVRTDTLRTDNMFDQLELLAGALGYPGTTREATARSTT